MEAIDAVLTTADAAPAIREIANQNRKPITDTTILPVKNQRPPDTTSSTWLSIVNHHGFRNTVPSMQL